MAMFTRRIESRGCEADARGRIPPGALARYLEHARWEAIADPSTGFSPLFSGGGKLVVRSQSLRFGAPLSGSTQLELGLQVAQVGNTSFKLYQRVTRSSDGASVVEGLLTGVALDLHNKPTRVPDSLREGVVPDAAPLASFDIPDWRAPADGVSWSTAIAVRPSDLDSLQHVNQSRYLDYVDDVRELAARADAYPGLPRVQRAFPRGVQLDYQRETRLGDALLATTWPLPGERAIAVELTGERDGQTVLRARLDLAE